MKGTLKEEGVSSSAGSSDVGSGSSPVPLLRRAPPKAIKRPAAAPPALPAPPADDVIIAKSWLRRTSQMLDKITATSSSSSSSSSSLDPQLAAEMLLRECEEQGSFFMVEMGSREEDDALQSAVHRLEQVRVN